MNDPTRPLLLEHAPTHGCPDEADEGEPVIDARAIPHKLRHGALLGAWAAVRPSESMVLLAGHDPIPLLAKMAHRDADAIQIEYLERGPEVWRVRVARSQ